MTDQLLTISILGMDITVYALMGIGYYLLLSCLSIFRAGKRISRPAAALYALFSGALGLLLGRAVYALVRMDTLFYGDMGEFLGLAPFFDTGAGSVSIVGVILGLTLSALILGRLTGKRAALYLDHAVLFAIAYFILMRACEHLGGHGNGDLLMEPALCFAPLARENEWGDWFLAVNNIEAVLGAAALLALLRLQKGVKKPGTLSLYAAVLFAATQIIPECLRWDDVLYIFIFARVTQIGLAVMLFASLLIPLIKGSRAGLSKKALAMEITLMLLGILLCIGTIFALDKTNLPKLLIYAVMLLALSGMAFLACRRIHKEDIRGC